jgi:hypothetical protein
MQSSRPPEAQLLYGLDLEANDSHQSETGPAHTMDIEHYPPLPPALIDKLKWGVPTRCLHAPLPLRGTAQPWQWAVVGAQSFIPVSETLHNVHNVMCHWDKIMASTIAN